jgi:MFS family permease
MYGMVFGIGLARGFFGPATFSIMAQILPKNLYPNASTWSSSSWQLASILGPSAGGLIYGFYGITPTYLVIITFIIISLVCLFFLKKHPPYFYSKREYC